MMIMGERRQEIKEEFRGIKVQVIEYEEENEDKKVMRERICEICWIMERKRKKLGSEEIE